MCRDDECFEFVNNPRPESISENYQIQILKWFRLGSSSESKILLGAYGSTCESYKIVMNHVDITGSDSISIECHSYWPRMLRANTHKYI